VEHGIWELQRLLQAGLYLKAAKCEFHMETVRDLWQLILTKGILIVKDKVKTVRNWGRNKKGMHGRLNPLFNVQYFLGFCNHY